MINVLSFILMLFTILIIVFVLFKFLKADAFATKRGWKLTGAAAGFVIIFGSVMGIYTQLFHKQIPLEEHENQIKILETEYKNTIDRMKLEKWTIHGKIEKEGDPSFAGIDAHYSPPEPLVNIDTVTKRITLSDVLLCSERGYPTITFKCPGYYPVTHEIDENKTHLYKINQDLQKIEILKTIKLEKE